MNTVFRTFLGSIVIVGLLGIAPIAHASVFPTSTLSNLFRFARPFGGKVVATVDPTITCTNTEGGPITIIPARPSYPTRPYATTLNTDRNAYITIKPGDWIIGLYSIIPNMTTCINPETGSPVHVIEIKTYGVSKGVLAI